MPGPVEGRRNSLAGMPLAVIRAREELECGIHATAPSAGAQKERPARRPASPLPCGSAVSYAALLRRRRAAPKMPISPVASSVIDAGSGVAVTSAWMLVGFAALLTPMA